MPSYPAILAPKRRASLEMLCPYEPGRPAEEVRREFGLSRMVHLASNENPLGASPRVEHALRHAGLDWSSYPDFEGWKLREAIAARLAVPVRRVAIGAGSAELMLLLALAFLDADSEAIVGDISFPLYENVIRLARACPVKAPLDAHLGYDLQLILDRVTPRTRMLFLATPNNPTGVAIPPHDLAAFLDRLPRHVLCVLDLAYWEYLSPSNGFDPVSLASKHDNVVVLRTFSKVYGLAGLRVGYAIAHEHVLAWLARVRVPFSTSTPAQYAAILALQDDAHLRNSVALNSRMRDKLARRCTALGLRAVPSDANFVLVDLLRDTDPVVQGLLRRGIVVRPVRAPRLLQCIRITTGTEDQTDEALVALQQVLTGPVSGVVRSA